MAEQQKETSSADPKKKSSLLDKDIEKEFLSSWKSISMVDDDGMDFSFDSVPKGKKKTFNFDKLDMDFNLDGEFDKISSFKVDMSDLDFSCSPKKPAKSKEKKEGESSGAKEGKQDDFNFSFDFNELDSFNLDSSLTKGDMTSNSKLDKMVTTEDGSDCEGATKKRKPSDAESVHASKDSLALKSLTSDGEETSEVKTLVGNPGDLISRSDDPFSKFSSSGNLDMSVGARASSDICKTLSTEERDQERELPEKIKSTESKSQEVISKPPAKLVEQNDSEQESIPDQHTEVCSQGKNVITGSGGKQKANHNKATSVNSDGENLLLENSSPLRISKSESNDGEAIKLGSSTQGEATNDLQPMKTRIKDNTKTGLLKNISDDREKQKSTFDCHKAPASSQPLVDTLMKDKEIQGRQSKYFPEDNKPLMYQSSTAWTKGISFGCQKVGDRCLTTVVEARESSSSIDTESGSESVNDSNPAPRERMTDAPILLGGKDDVKSSSNSREGIVSNGMASGGKLAGNMQSLHKEVKKSKAILLETSMPTKDVNVLSSQVNPSSLSEKTVGHAIQMSVSPQADISGKESFQKLKVGSVEGNKLASISAGKITPALSSLKTSRSTGTNKVLATSLRQKESNTSRNSEQNVEMQGITASKNDHFIDSSDKQKLLTPFLKRKNIEVSEADLVSLRSLKRLSQSHSKSRSSKECSEKVVEQVESRPKNLLGHDPISRLESPLQMNLTEVGIPDSILVEDNSNVEKAEAYNKELENICNMLKKKHEEAKEILVRAVVNNNNLLMLNHPIYEEKIRKVQKFASQLMSKGIQT